LVSVFFCFVFCLSSCCSSPALLNSQLIDLTSVSWCFWLETGWWWWWWWLHVTEKWMLDECLRPPTKSSQTSFCRFSSSIIGSLGFLITFAPQMLITTLISWQHIFHFYNEIFALVLEHRPAYVFILVYLAMNWHNFAN
jgi:hypothetical protein